jgi:hypothetical protein
VIYWPSCMNLWDFQHVLAPDSTYMHIMISCEVLHPHITLNEICSLRYALMYVKRNQVRAFPA